MQNSHKPLSIGILAEIINGASGARAPIELAIALAKRHHHVTFYATNTMQDPNMIKYLNKNHVSVSIIKIPHIPFLNRIYGSFLLWKRLRESKHDILQAQVFPLFNLAGQLSGIPVITGYYGSQFFPLKERLRPNDASYAYIYIFDSLLNAYIWIVTYIILALSREVSPISEYCAYELKKLYFRTGTTIYLAPAVFETPKKLVRNIKFYHLLSVSRITRYKGFHKVIEAFKIFHVKYPNSALTIAGSQPNPKYLSYLKSIAKNVPVTFLINPHDQILRKLYMNSSVYVSADENLFFGMPPLEAAQFGIPALLFKAKAAAELVNPGTNGYLFRGVHQLAYYMELLCRNKTLRSKLGKNAQNFSQKFTWDNTALAYEKLFYRIISKNEYTQISKNAYSYS